MQIRNTRERWGAVSVALHWLIAAGVLFMGALGLYMKGLPIGADKIAAYALHKSIGITLLALVLLRLAWRLTGNRPTLPAAVPRWQRALSSLSHVLLYVLLLAVPTAGWVLNSAADFPLRWFGWFSLPAIVEPSRALRAAAGDAHEALFWTLVVLMLVHIGAALKHHFVDRDNVLRSMLGLKPLRSGDT